MSSQPIAVFRIESYVGEGPYVDGDVKLFFDWARHPHLEDEGFFYDTCDLFGFPDLVSLETWFYQELREQLLYDGGYGIGVYSVPSDQCVVSPTQLAFCQDNAERLNWISLQTSYNSAGLMNKTKLKAFIAPLINGLEAITHDHELVHGRKSIHEDRYDWSEMSID